MRIRSITCFLNPTQPSIPAALQQAAHFLSGARQALESSGYEVQTTRIASVPFPELIRGKEAAKAVELAVEIEQEAARLGIDYVSLGPASLSDPETYRIIPAILEATRNVFVSAPLGAEGAVSLPAVRACGEVIARVSTVTPDGFTNLRFTSLGNVAPGSPFFPAAYHTGEQPSFALATEAADLAVNAYQDSQSLVDARGKLLEAIETNASALEAVCRGLEKTSGFHFNGLDFTLAPFPEDPISFGAALENLGVPRVGDSGSLAAAAISADTLDQARFTRTGFCGLMLPVLEDSRLAKRAADGCLRLNDLLLYSAVCGTGLDTVPLPGDATPAQLSAVLLDLACLAYRLDKPLTARLMPIPGKAAGDPVEYEFSYFANSRVMDLPAAELGGALASRDSIPLRPRSERRQASSTD